MSKEAYFSGESIQLSDMLRAREERALRQLHLLKEYPEGSLLSVTMNIPGPIKTSPKLLEAFDIVIKAIQTALADDKICYQLRLLPTTGYEYYLITSLPSRDLKLKMIALETELPIGRLMDLDVLVLQNDLPHSISRTVLGGSLGNVLSVLKRPKSAVAYVSTVSRRCRLLFQNYSIHFSIKTTNHRHQIRQVDEENNYDENPYNGNSFT